MKITKRIITLLLTLALILAVPLTVFAQTTIIIDTNGGSKQYGPGSELVLIGVVQNSGVALANTDVAVAVTSAGREIHYANVRTDARGVFRTWFSVPQNVSGAMTVTITAAGVTKTDSIALSGGGAGPSLTGFVESVGYLDINSPRTIPANTQRFGLIFSNNVSAYMNNNPSTDESRAVVAVVGNNYGAIERNRDCFTLFKENSSGVFTRIGSSVQLGGTFNTANITWLGSSGNTGSTNAVFITPSEGIQPGTTYRLDISGRLTANNSRLMGADVSVYFTTDGTNPESRPPVTGGGGGGMSGGAVTAVEAEAEVTGERAVVEYEDDVIIAALENAAESGADTLEFVVSGEAVDDVSEFVFNLSESQVALIRSSVEFVVFNTLFSAT